MSFSSLCVFTYAYPVSFLSKCHAKNRKEVLAVRTSYRKEVLALLTCSRKEVLAVSRTQAQARPAISRKKNFFLRTQKEVLAHALFLDCTVCLITVYALAIVRLITIRVYGVSHTHSFIRLC